MLAEGTDGASLITPLSRQDESAAAPGGTKKLRAACDACHNAKIKCSGGGVMCARCVKDKVQCRYSYRGNLGKPKGSLNKKTLERMRRAAQLSNQDPGTISPDRGEPDAVPGTTVVPTDAGSSISAAFNATSPILGVNEADAMHLEEEDVDIFGEFGLAEFPMFDPFESDHNKSTDTTALQDKLPPANVLPTPPFLSTDFAQQGLGDLTENNSPNENGEGGKDLEMFEMLANAFTSPPRTSSISTISSISSHTQHPQHNHLIHQTSMTNSRNARLSHSFLPSAASPPEASVSCSCFQVLSGMLCQVRALGRKNVTVGLDVVLDQTRPMLSVIAQFLRCSSCSSDPQVFLQALMILQSVFQLYRNLIHPPEMSCAQLDIRIGNFSVPHGVGNTVKMLVIIVELGNAKKLLDTFAGRVELLPASGSQVEFLKSQTQSLIQGLQAMAKRLRLPDISPLVR